MRGTKYAFLKQKLRNSESRKQKLRKQKAESRKIETGRKRKKIKDEGSKINKNRNMNLNDIITFIKNNKKFMREQYGVEKIGVFGSYVK